jgi:hypothetical protein
VEAQGRLPLSAEAQLSRLGDLVGELEQLCNELELSLRASDWKRLDAAIASSRRKMHEFENAMADAKSLRTAEFDRVIYARLQKIYSVRAGQMERLQGQHDEIGGRLRTLSRWKEYSRSIAGPDARNVKARLFEERR